MSRRSAGTRISRVRLSGWVLASAGLLGFLWTSCTSNGSVDEGTGGGPGEAAGGGGLTTTSGGAGSGGSISTATGGTGSPSTATGGANPSGGSSAGGAVGGSSCGIEPLEPSAQTATPRVDLESQPPMPEGGTISDGVYDQIDYVFYEEVDVSSLVLARQAMRFRSGGGTVDIARQDSIGQRLDVTMGVATDGTRLILTAACPEVLVGAKEESDYTAASEDLWVFLEQLGSTAVIHYAKR